MYPGYVDPFAGDYRHCLAGCISVRRHGPVKAAVILKAWDCIYEDNLADSAAGWRGYKVAMTHPFTTCREACKDETVRPIGPIDD